MKSRTQVLIATSLMVTFLGFGCNTSEAGPSDNSPTAVSADGNGISERDCEEVWEEVDKKWDGMDEVKVSNFEEVYDEVNKQKEDMAIILKPLIDNKTISNVTADAITHVYGENLRNSLEATVDLPCCYKPMMIPEWDCAGVDTREGLEKKLALLEEFYEKGEVEKEVITKAKKGIEDRLNLLSEADEYWQDKGEGPCEEHPAQVDVLLHLFDLNAGGIKEGNTVGPDLIKGSEYIVILENNN